MNKQTALTLAGGAARLAELLGITTGAVSQWGDVVPESRVWQLKVQRPEWFAEQAPKAIQAKEAA